MILHCWRYPTFFRNALLLSCTTDCCVCIRKDGSTPLDLVTDTDGACNAVLHHHTVAFTAIRIKPTAFVSTAVSHCAALNLPEEPMSVYLHDPPYLWAPFAARVPVFKWARGAAVIHIAANTEPFLSLADDCAGDVLEYLEIAMTRADSLHITEHCSSLKAQAWVQEVMKAAVAVSKSLVLSIPT
jgi:hypothetical protein